MSKRRGQGKGRERSIKGRRIEVSKGRAFAANLKRERPCDSDGLYACCEGEKSQGSNLEGDSSVKSNQGDLSKNWGEKQARGVGVGDQRE